VCDLTNIQIGIISITHIHREIEGLRIRKSHRIVIRFSVAIILVCLPLARNLNSLELIGVVTGLIVFTLMGEIWGNSCMFESFFGTEKTCQYTAECQVKKKDLEDAIKAGGTTKIEALVNESEISTQRALYELS